MRYPDTKLGKTLQRIDNIFEADDMEGLVCFLSEKVDEVEMVQEPRRKTFAEVIAEVDANIAARANPNLAR